MNGYQDWKHVDTSDKQSSESKVLEALLMLAGSVLFFVLVLVATA